MVRRRGSDGGEAEQKDTFAAEALTYLDGLYGAALRLTRDRADADDLVQETYARAFRFAAQYQRGTNLKAWLFTILYNLDRNRRRDHSRDAVFVDSSVVEQAEAQPSQTETPEQILMRGTLDADLQAAVDALPESFRQAVWLRDVEEFSYSEIASMLKIPIGTVMSRIARGRRLLYEALTARTDRFGSVEVAGRG